MSDVAGASFLGLLEAVPEAVVCVAADGTVAAANARAERLFGYGHGELAGASVDSLVPQAAQAARELHRASYLASPGPRQISDPAAGQRKDGGTFPAEIFLAPVGAGEGLLVAATIRDAGAELTKRAERAGLEEQLQQSRRLESLGQLAGGVAHDFNNLLGVISSYTGFVAEELGRRAGGDETWRAALDDLERVQLAATRAAGLTHQLLTFSRREVVKPDVLNLNETLSNVLNLLQRTLGEHVRLVTRPAPHLRFVIADPGQVEQVLVNLAVNARDAMPAGGTLTIETANVDVDEAYASSHQNLSAGPYVALTVSDTGAGMPADVASRAFEPFFTTKPEAEATGLGLTTIYGIATGAGGNVRIDSEPGFGTTIKVLLPSCDQPEQAPSQPPGGPPRGAGQLILLVEDEPALREVARRILARNGYEVIVAAGGQDALDTVSARGARADLLVTDVIMPGIQGRALADLVSAALPDIAVLYMSGYAQGLLSGQGVLEPGIHLIEKPFTESALLTKVAAALGAADLGDRNGQDR